MQVPGRSRVAHFSHSSMVRKKDSVTSKLEPGMQNAVKMVVQKDGAPFHPEEVET